MEKNMEVKSLLYVGIFSALFIWFLIFIGAPLAWVSLLILAEIWKATLIGLGATIVLSGYFTLNFPQFLRIMSYAAEKLERK